MKGKIVEERIALLEELYEPQVKFGHELMIADNGNLYPLSFCSLDITKKLFILTAHYLKEKTDVHMVENVNISKTAYLLMYFLMYFYFIDCFLSV